MDRDRDRHAVGIADRLGQLENGGMVVAGLRGIDAPGVTARLVAGGGCRFIKLDFLGFAVRADVAKFRSH